MKKILSSIKSALMIIGGLLLILLSACVGVSKKQLHGEDLLKLSDDKLFEAVYLQTLELVDSFVDEEAALKQISPVQRTVYILSIYDMEIQNGGLCQFFVNSSRSLAPHVNPCLKTVGAEAHNQLFAEFVANNQVDLHNLDSFEIADVKEYAAQTERYDFDAFDNAYFELAPLQDYIVAYIKANITEF
jgi:hypothetical protein